MSTRYGVPAAAYVFGHNHRAERLDLPDAPAAVYLNAGTWGTEVRGPGPDQLDRQLFPFVRIAGTPGNVEAELRSWRHSPREAPAPGGEDDGPNRVATLVQTPVSAREREE